MSIFGRIFPIKDILARVPQLESQVEKLEKEHDFEKGNKNRSSFIKRCEELQKQIENQQTRISNLKMKESSEDKRLAQKAKEDLVKIQNRLTDISPISTTEQSITEEKITSEEPHTDVIIEEEVIDESPVHNIPSNRRPSMYDEVEDDDDDERYEDEDDEELREQMPPPQTESQKGTSVTKQEYSSPDMIERKETSKEALEVVEGNKFLVLGNLDAQEEGDLTIRKGEILSIIQTRPDGWWTGVNSVNRSGLVPKTFLRHLPVEELSQALRILETSSRSDSENSNIKKKEVEKLVKAKVDMSKSAHMADESVLPRPSSTLIPPLAMAMNKSARCLGDALLVDPHLTYACHLTPRLSHSNLAFHDLYWNHEDDKLRKRHVRVSCLIRLIRFEGMPRDIHTGLIRVALYDTSRKTGKQLVSNVHTIRAQIKGSTWNFISRADTANTGIDFSDFLLRSNYKMKEVILLLQASIITFDEGKYVEKALGTYRLPMIGDNFESCIAKKTYSDYLMNENIFDSLSPSSKTNYKIVLKALDVPKDLVQYVDALPDVLLFNPMFIRITYFYRRRAGTLLLRDRSNPLSAEMISDPLLSVFPHVADQPDLMDLINGMYMSRFKQLKIKTETNQAQTFFQVFMNTAYCIHRTAVMPTYCMWDKKLLAERQEVLKKCVDMLREYKSAARFLLTTTSKPINIYDYSLDIMGIHALD